MKYMGSKARYAKFILPIIHKIIKVYNIQNYCEPFVGGCNMIDKVECKNKVGSDNNKYLIALLNNVHKIEELPLDVSFEHYSEVRESYKTKNGNFEDWYIGAIGFLASCNGRFFDGGYAKPTDTRNFYDEAKRNLEKQVDSLCGIKFFHKDYSLIKKDLKGWLIYCDPPYKNTKKYDTSRDFDYEKFYSWCREMSKNNIVLISEQEMPSDFNIIWEQEVTRAIGCQDSIKAKERLFTYNKLQL